MKVGDLVEVTLDKESLCHSKALAKLNSACKNTCHVGRIVYIDSEIAGVEFDHPIYLTRPDNFEQSYYSCYGRGRNGFCAYVRREALKPHNVIPQIPSWDQIMKDLLREKLESAKYTKYSDWAKLGRMSYNVAIQANNSDRVMAFAMAMMGGADLDIDKRYIAGSDPYDQRLQPIGPEEVLLCQ